MWIRAGARRLTMAALTSTMLLGDGPALARGGGSGSHGDDLTFIDQAPASQHWDDCTDPAGYYPWIQQCGSQWILVDPRPPE